jgi:nucleotide-binding universal stress UspA family protein
MYSQARTASASEAATRPRYGSVLVVVGDLPTVDTVLPEAVSIAQRDRAILTFLYAVPDTRVWFVAAGFGAMALAYLPSDPEGAARRSLNAAVARTPADIGVRTSIVRGRPGPAIVAHAAAWSYDAIIMPASAPRLCRRWGAEAYVRRHARIPVLLATSTGPLAVASSNG